MSTSETRQLEEAVIVGSSPLNYRVVKNWLQIPTDIDLNEVTAVAADSQDRVYIFNRGSHPVVIVNSSGEYLSSWGKGLFSRPHGITIHNDVIYAVDDLDHTVKQLTLDGQLLMTLGKSGTYSKTGATTVDYRTIRQAGPPFNFPTNLAIAPSGEIYIADGYGNARIHRFSSEGRLISSWGDPGSEPGQFHIPHGIAIDAKGLVYVADRENSRIQIFAADGTFQDQWNGLARPCQLYIDDSYVYVAELGYHAGRWPGTIAPSPDATGGRISIYNDSGVLLSRWGGGMNPCAAGDFFAPHDVWVDSRHAIYVSEVVMSAGGNRGLVDPACHTLQKFELSDREI